MCKGQKIFKATGKRYLPPALNLFPSIRGETRGVSWFWNSMLTVENRLPVSITISPKVSYTVPFTISGSLGFGIG